LNINSTKNETSSSFLRHSNFLWNQAADGTPWREDIPASNALEQLDWRVSKY
jgi:hypothetical protein